MLALFIGKNKVSRAREKALKVHSLLQGHDSPSFAASGKGQLLDDAMRNTQGRLLIRLRLCTDLWCIDFCLS